MPMPAPRRLDVQVPPEQAGARLDRALSELVPELSRTRIQALAKAGKVACDGSVLRDPAARVAAGAVLSIDVPPPETTAPAAEAIALDIVYEDDALIVIDKPAGLVVHPAPGQQAGTLVNALLAHCGTSLSAIGGEARPGIVHRLDKDTSGLLVVAKTDQAHRALQQQFADHGRTGPLERVYVAVAWGVPRISPFTVDAPIRRDPRNREKMAVAPPGLGREAITHGEVVERFGGANAPASLIRCQLETGRTHQIRVHMAHSGHPVLGDRLYGSGFRTKESLLAAPARDALAALGRQALHAETLAFAHPVSGARLAFQRPPPADMARLIAALRREPAADTRR
jgi:23S rRNA pseudouridine1911/1915/1917 synthase